MTRNKKIAIAAAIFFAVFIIFCTAILPFIVRDKAAEALQQATGRKVTISSVSINPFLLAVTVKGFVIKENNGSDLVSINRIRTSLGLASIFKRALILSSVEIDTPVINVTRNAPNSYNFSDIVSKLQANKKPAPPTEKETRFSINNISITNGSADFNDQAVSGGRKHTVRSLNMNIPFISNIPYLVEKYTDPKLSAVINGAAFNFEGKLKPLSKSLETSVQVDLKQLDLPELIAYSPVRPPADLTTGKLTVDTDISYKISADKKPELIIKGLVRFNDININMRNGQPLIKLPQFELKASKLEAFASIFEFERIGLESLQVYASRNSKGKWMYEELLGTQPAKKPQETKKANKNDNVKEPQLTIAALAIRNSSFHLKDELPKNKFNTSLSQIELELKNFSNLKDKSSEYTLSFQIGKDADFGSEGTFSVNPATMAISAELEGFDLTSVKPYLEQYLTSPVKGVVDLSAEAKFNKEGGLIVQNGAISVNGLATTFGSKDKFDLSLFELSGAEFNQKLNSISIDKIQISKGNLSVSREIDNSISLMLLLKKQNPSATKQPGQPKSASNASGKSAAAPPPLSYKLKQLQMDKFNLLFTDKSFESKPRFTLRNMNLMLANLNGPKFTPAQMKFAATFGKNSPFRASGEITPQPFKYKGGINITRLPIRDFEEYFPDSLNLFVIGGLLDTRLNVNVALKDGKPSGTFRGSTGIRAFHCIDGVAEEDLLKWESLQLDQFQGNIAPFNMSINQIALNGVYSKIIVHKDGTLNLQNLIVKQPQPASASAGQPASSPPTSAAAPAITAATKPAVNAQQPATNPAKTQISIGTITVQEGTLAFSDNHMPKQFATTFFNLGGRVSGLTSENTKFADVDLRGNLENHSPLQITGKINPLRDDLFVDLKVSFRDIDLTPTTPYTGTFLGYTVEKGKLTLELNYHIEKKELRSDNKIFVDQFTFGNKVESDKATSLPVKLGLALLKDRKGEIHLDVPITGRTDDPQFSVWKLVFQVLKNLLVKAATSPFSLLSSMFGGGADLSTINFENGTSTLPQAEEVKLVALAKALTERPALKMEIKGYVDREKDAEGYRVEMLNRKIRNEKLIFMTKEGQLTQGQGINDIKLIPEEYSKYLKVVYKKEKFPKPRNFIGMLKDLPDNEMKKLIITNTVVSENDLQNLAKDRSTVIMNHLIRKGKITADRIFLKSDNIYKAPEKSSTVKSRVELNVIVK